MHDPVADVLRQRAALGTGAGAGIAVSLALHGAITALAIYAAVNAPPPKAASVLNIKLAPAAKAPPRAAAPHTAAAAAPRIEEPKPQPAKPVAKPPEKNTVPLSPFGRSTKKGSEAPAPERPVPAPAVPAATSTAPEVPVGGSGVTGLEGGDFPYTLYLQAMQRRIGGNWVRPQVAPGTEVIVYFRIQRDGTITDVKVVTPSVNPTFDRLARSAVQSSNPLNPLPFAYNGTYLGVHLTFR